MSDGGKGSAPRPFTDRDQFEKNFQSIFGESKLERKIREEAERKKREAALDELVKINQELGLYDELDNTGVQKNEYYDIISTEDCFEVEDPDPDKRSWYYDEYGVKRKKK